VMITIIPSVRGAYGSQCKAGSALPT
jgi:hypothetical protein